MTKIVLVESVPREAERLKTLLARDEFEIIWCQSPAEAERVISPQDQQLGAAIIRWEISEPQLGFRLLLHCRKVWPELPVIVVSASLDATMVTRAHKLGARDFLELPLDSERIRSCLGSLLSKDSQTSPLHHALRDSIMGESTALLAALDEVAEVIPRDDLNVLISGEPGTGKELFAKAIHNLGNRAGKPLVDVNVGAIAETLIESELFGHEKGAFTGANDKRSGYLEQAGNGTLFLDEIGDLDLSLQVKLLRVLQERQFRRVGADTPQVFKARVVFATNRDLPKEVNKGLFRRDLYDRITEAQIHVPPLRDRQGDIDLLAEYFLKVYSPDRRLRWMPDTLSVLRSYSFPGNIRELQNVVKGAVLACNEEFVRPRHLPLNRMSAFTEPDAGPTGNSNTLEEFEDSATGELQTQLTDLMKPNWLDLSYRDAFASYEQAFDRVYLSHLLRNHRHISRAAAVAGIDVKTFKKRWRDCGLPPLTGAGDAPNG